MSDCLTPYLREQRVALLPKPGDGARKLASVARISRGYLASVETGRHEPSLTMLDRLAKGLKIRMTDLLR